MVQTLTQWYRKPLVSYIVEYTFVIYDPAIPSLGYLPKRTETCLHKILYTW